MEGKPTAVTGKTEGNGCGGTGEIGKGGKVQSWQFTEQRAKNKRERSPKLTPYSKRHWTISVKREVLAKD